MIGFQKCVWYDSKTFHNDQIIPYFSWCNRFQSQSCTTQSSNMCKEPLMKIILFNIHNVKVLFKTDPLWHNCDDKKATHICLLLCCHDSNYGTIIFVISWKTILVFAPVYGLYINKQLYSIVFTVEMCFILQRIPNILFGCNAWNQISAPHSCACTTQQILSSSGEVYLLLKITLIYVLFWSANVIKPRVVKSTWYFLNKI